jgi:hypothetical protein
MYGNVFLCIAFIALGIELTVVVSPYVLQYASITFLSFPTILEFLAFMISAYLLLLGIGIPIICAWYWIRIITVAYNNYRWVDSVSDWGEA